MNAEIANYLKHLVFIRNNTGINLNIIACPCLDSEGGLINYKLILTDSNHFENLQTYVIDADTLISMRRNLKDSLLHKKDIEKYGEVDIFDINLDTSILDNYGNEAQYPELEEEIIKYFIENISTIIREKIMFNFNAHKIDNMFYGNRVNGEVIPVDKGEIQIVDSNRKLLLTINY